MEIWPLPNHQAATIANLLVKDFFLLVFESLLFQKMCTLRDKKQEQPNMLRGATVYGTMPAEMGAQCLSGLVPAGAVSPHQLAVIRQGNPDMDTEVMGPPQPGDLTDAADAGMVHASMKTFEQEGQE